MLVTPRKNKTKLFKRNYNNKNTNLDEIRQSAKLNKYTIDAWWTCDASNIN
jgi:uncharacterized protein (DUF1919 family)